MTPQTTYAGQDGLIVLEAESAAAQGDWDARTIGGEDGLLWDADRSNYGTVDHDEKLTYRFTPDEDGTYYAALHSARVKSTMNDSDRYENGSSGDERTDTGNDIYLGVKDVETGEYVQDPIKLFTGLGSSDRELKWGTTFDSGGKRAASVTLEADKEYDLEIIGRSDGYFLDKITLNKGAALRDADAAESPVAQAPVVAPVVEDDPPVTVDPPAPAETPTVTTPPAAETPMQEAEPAPAADTQDDSGDDNGGIFAAIFQAIGSLFEAIFSIFGGGGSGSSGSTANDVASAAGQAPTSGITLSELIPVTGTYDESLPQSQDELDEMLID